MIPMKEASMEFGFISARKRGIHYELAKFAANKLRSANLLVKGKTERHFEHTIVSHLQASTKLRNNLITQIGEEEVDKISQANLFGFHHRPDTTIGKDGTAIEIKAISSSQSIRDVLGQAVAYRMHYRFVILVLVDQTTDRQVVELCRDKRSQEYSLLRGLSESLNIFTVVGPLDQSKNIVFAS
jgi:hypothetical protein